jgi:signal transduction histidine kinase
MNKQSIDILLIEDTCSDAEMLQRMLRRSKVLFSPITWVQSIADAADAIREIEFDVILTDLGLPDITGIETITRLRGLTDRLPIIALTGQDEDDTGLSVIKAGASDFIPKALMSEPVISRAITHSIERFQLATKVVDANRLLESKNERLAQMYKMSQQFVDNVSHEFRTPLTVVREFAAIVRDGIDGPVTVKQKCRLSTLINRTDDLANMVDDLLDTSRLEAGLLRTCREEHELSDIVGQVERMLRTRAVGKKITLVVGDIQEGTKVFCDAEKLRRVLINLLVNAIKFTPIGGRVEISATLADKDRVRITVADNGPGIAAEELQRIFERFQQVEAHHRMASCKGFGLGLSIARALASLNLGSLQVNSVLGKGTHFSVLVPRAKLESILNCYFDQRAKTLDKNEKISLLEVYPETLDFEDRPNAIESIDDFLRSSVKSFDLVLKSDDCRWLVYACNSATSLPTFKNRIMEKWANQKRNHYGASLPNLAMDVKATLNVVPGREQLIKLARPQKAITGQVANRTALSKVLVVDDELDVAAAIESRLAAGGFDVSTANDGVSGLEAVERFQPDVILLDIRMPKMDGLTVLHRLKSNPETASTPVIVLSASMRDKQKVLDLGASFFIQKPYQSDSLMAALDAAIENLHHNPTGVGK